MLVTKVQSWLESCQDFIISQLHPIFLLHDDLRVGESNDLYDNPKKEW